MALTSHWDAPALGDFYFQAFDESVSPPPLDITTTATGLLRWRDSHPLEWQLASLHDQNEKSLILGPYVSFH